MIDTDDTQRADAPPDDETQVVPDLAPTGVADPLAWSDTEVIDDLPARRSWRAAVVRAAVVLALTLGVAGGITAVSIHHHTYNAHPASTTTAAPKPRSVPPKMELAMAPGTTPQDRVFFERLGAHKIWYPVSAQDGMIYNAHVLCGIRRDATDLDAMAQGFHDRNPDLTLDDARQFIEISVDVYCPEVVK